MTNVSDSYANYRRRSLESARHLSALQSSASNHGDREQLPAELIAHLVIALSRYHRLLRAEGGRVPPEIEDLVIVLTDRARTLRDVPMLDPWRGGAERSATPRRLLVTKSEAAGQLCVSLRTLERLISAGRLPLVHVEGAARVRVADLEAYVRRLEADDRPSAAAADEPCPPDGSDDDGSPTQALPAPHEVHQ